MESIPLHAPKDEPLPSLADDQPPASSPKTIRKRKRNRQRKKRRNSTKPKEKVVKEKKKKQPYVVKHPKSYSMSPIGDFLVKFYTFDKASMARLGTRRRRLFKEWNTSIKPKSHKTKKTLNISLSNSKIHAFNFFQNGRKKPVVY